MINIDDFKKVEIKAGKILSAEFIEGSEKLLKLMVDFGGTEPRQVLSGIRKYFEDPQVLVGVTTAFVTNLEPRPMMGLESQAMILAASGESENGPFFCLLRMDCPPGSPVK
jgi:methionyl-tRNA synthetase